MDQQESLGSWDLLNVHESLRSQHRLISALRSWACRGWGHWDLSEQGPARPAEPEDHQQGVPVLTLAELQERKGRVRPWGVRVDRPRRPSTQGGAPAHSARGRGAWWPAGTQPHAGGPGGS